VVFLSTKTGQFTYFAQQLGASNWRGKNVLDFGGNVGNILRDANSTIDHERYWCIDVVPESMRNRLLSLRAFDATGMMLDADVVEGDGVEALIDRMFEDTNVAYIHAHNARRGCYAARIDRA